MGKQQANNYATNSIISNRYDINNILDSEIKNEKFQKKIQNKYNRNVYIQKLDDLGNPTQMGFLHKDGKLKSEIHYNQFGQPIKEVYRSNYGVGDYTAITKFIYNENGELKKTLTKIDDGAELVREY